MFLAELSHHHPGIRDMRENERDGGADDIPSP
jgi:hypothetical protein